MENEIGIMQGRLSSPIDNRIQAFPKNNWKDEFELASRIGFNKIEWVCDSNDNPILYESTLSEISNHAKKFNVKINSLCADYFMKNKLFSESKQNIEKNLEFLKNIIKNCHKLDLHIIEIPLVDNSTIRNQDNKKQFKENLESIISTIENYNIIIALETDLEQNELKDFISEFNHPNIKLNYDIGNSTANKFDVEKEFNLLDKWITNIHVKDRLTDSYTVPLGDGDVNFDRFFNVLKQKNYQGDLIIQGAREDLFDNSTSPIETCKKYLVFVKQYLDKYQ